MSEECLLTLNYAWYHVGACCVHAGANLFNTYYDHAHGNDTPSPSTDDRALVDEFLVGDDQNFHVGARPPARE